MLSLRCGEASFYDPIPFHIKYICLHGLENADCSCTPQAYAYVVATWTKRRSKRLRVFVVPSKYKMIIDFGRCSNLLVYRMQLRDRVGMLLMLIFFAHAEIAQVRPLGIYLELSKENGKGLNAR